ncbi:hypothetical protein P691DRAFT_769247 [Macrolepiota fuliginosa MF-IS2]|uniref:Uncharacterized protein n=1 Tax=Macrolepiota fuliginosa MF-IS2 TaxID=1400762 RepID=A0A9P5WVV1_9AGAR|nr:hypothetical protein P691DRAFT_769247 [Macrolepiota fuliginosa MF-IS2]
MLPYDPLERKAPTDFFPDDEYYNSSNDSKIDAIHKERDFDASEGEDSGQATGRGAEKVQESLESEEDIPNVPTSTMCKITTSTRLAGGNGKRKLTSLLEITSPDQPWEWAHILPLSRVHILKAYQTCIVESSTSINNKPVTKFVQVEHWMIMFNKLA